MKTSLENLSLEAYKAYTEKKWNLAISTANRAIKEYPIEGKAYCLRALILAERGEFTAKERPELALKIWKNALNDIHKTHKLTAKTNFDTENEVKGFETELNEKIEIYQRKLILKEERQKQIKILNELKIP